MMKESPLLRFVAVVLLSTITSTTVYPQTTKSKKGGSGDTSSSGDQSGSDGTDDSSGGSKAGGKDTSKTDDKSKGDTSKAAFDDGTYAEATAITYKAMQSIAKEIAKKHGGTAKTFVVFDPVTFANIAQYRIQFPQVVLLRTGLCGVLTKMDDEKAAEAEKKKKDDAATQEVARPRVGADSSLPGISPAGQIVDLAQKVLTMMQTTTTVAGASVNVTDEALVAEVASNLHKPNDGLTVYYPGEFLLPDMDETEINSAITDPFCAGGQPLGQAHHIVAEVVRLGVDREEAAGRYQLLTAALDKYNAVVNPTVKKTNPEQPAQTNQADPTDKTKKKKTNGAAGAVQAPAQTPATSDPPPAHVPTAQEKKDALDQFYVDAGFTNVVKATGYQANLKSYMDAYDALLTSLATTDAKGQTMFSRLVIAERLDSILKPPPDTKTTSNINNPSQPASPPASASQSDQAKVTAQAVNVVIVKWLRAGALNKTRKNLFFLGQRNYYAGGATALYEYFDGNQNMLASGTITRTSPYVHDKDFDKGKMDTIVDLSPTDPDTAP